MTNDITLTAKGQDRLVAEAEQLQQLGFSIIPTLNKRPLIAWDEYQTRKATNEEVVSWIGQYPEMRWGVVTGPISNLFVLDVDGNVEQLLGNYRIPATSDVKTPRGGMHFYLRWDDSLRDVPTTKFGLLPNVDIRGAGGFCVFYGWFNLVEFAPIPEWLKQLVKKPRTVAVKQSGWIADALNNLDVGQRHAAFAKLIGRLNRDGFAPDDIYTLLAPHAENCGLGTAELNDQVQDMCKRYADQAAKPLAALTTKQLLSSGGVKIPWLVDGLLPREGVGILAGHPKIGKSWLTLDLAISIAMGSAWLGKFKAEKGATVYVDEESSVDLLSSRVHKLLKYRGLDDAAIQFLVKGGFSFSNPAKIDELRQIADLVQPRLIVFDSLNRIHRANENSASEMGEIFRKVSALSKEFGCFVLFTDHLPHSGDRLRGSTDKAAFVDTGFLATKIGNSNVLVEHKYARMTEPVRAFELSVQDDGPDKTFINWIG